MKTFRLILAVIVVVSAPALKGYAAVPDLPFAVKDTHSIMQFPFLEEFVLEVASFFKFTPLDVTPSGMAAKIVEWVPAIDRAQVGAAKPTTVSEKDEELIKELITDLGANGVDSKEVKSSWFEKNKDVLLLGGILLFTALLVALVALFIGGSSGSGSGSGGSEGAGGSDVPTGTPLLGAGGGVAGGGGEGDGGSDGGPAGGGSESGSGSGTSPFGRSFPGPIPVNPEPSTLILTGLGLLLPYLRKKH